jgi:hypothetical protein
MSNVDELIDKAAILKADITDKTKILHALQEQIEALLEWPDKQASLTAFGRAFKAKIVTKTAVKWDQEKLDELRKTMGDDDFFTLFSFEYKPVNFSKLDNIWVYHQYYNRIGECKSESKARSSFTFERLESC